MPKKLLFILSIISILSLPALHVKAQNSAFDTEIGSNISEPAIELQGTTLKIINAEGSSVEIFSLTGSKVATYRVNSAEETITLSLKRGCYLIKVGKLVRKVAIR